MIFGLFFLVDFIDQTLYIDYLDGFVHIYTPLSLFPFLRPPELFVLFGVQDDIDG